MPLETDYYFLSGGGGAYHFWDLHTISFKSDAFETIFFITFCNGNNFLQTFLKKCYRPFIDLI